MGRGNCSWHIGDENLRNRSKHYRPDEVFVFPTMKIHYTIKQNSQKPPPNVCSCFFFSFIIFFVSQMITTTEDEKEESNLPKVCSFTKHQKFCIFFICSKGNTKKIKINFKNTKIIGTRFRKFVKKFKKWKN